MQGCLIHLFRSIAVILWLLLCWAILQRLPLRRRGPRRNVSVDASSDSNAQFISGNQSDSISGETWRVIAVSQRGLGHEISDIPNEDYYSACVVPATPNIPETVIICVADGAGSARLSELGSKTVSRVSVATLLSRLKSDADILRDTAIARQELLTAAEISIEALKSCATDNDANFEDLATTMQLVIANEILVAVLHIGDGRTVVLETDKFRNFSQPFNGEYTNETEFVTSRDGTLCDNPGLDRKEINGTDIYGVSVSTDGLDPLAVTLTTDEPFEGFYKPVFRMPWQAEGIENATIQLSRTLGMIETRQKSTDDITIVVATRKSDDESDTGKDVT